VCRESNEPIEHGAPPANDRPPCGHEDGDDSSDEDKDDTSDDSDDDVAEEGGANNNERDGDMAARESRRNVQHLAGSRSMGDPMRRSIEVSLSGNCILMISWTTFLWEPRSECHVVLA
jgi:hypothetical protein